jgi:hypothetical protein
MSYSVEAKKYDMNLHAKFQYLKMHKSLYLISIRCGFLEF